MTSESTAPQKNNSQRPTFFSVFKSVFYPLIVLNRRAGALISLLGAVHIIALLWIPIIVQHLFQQASQVRRIWDIAALGETLLLAALIVSASSLVLERASAKSLYRDLHTLEVKLFTKLLSLKVSETERLSIGYLQSRLRDDIPLVAPFLLGDFAPYLVIALQLVAVVVMLIHIDWTIAVVSVAFAVCVCLANSRFTPRLRRMSRTVQESGADLNGYIAEVITFLPVIKTCVAEGTERETFIRDSGRLNREQCTFSIFSRYLSEANSTMGRVGFLIIAIVGALRIQSGALSAAVFMSSIVYINVLLYSSRSLVNFTPRFASAMESAVRLGEVLSLESEKPRFPYLQMHVPGGAIELRKVSFAYDATRPLLVALNLSVPQGSKVAVVGPSGAGKTTLVKLLLGFEKPTSGELLVGGCNLEDLDIGTLRRNMGYVSQGSISVLRRTIRENIMLGRLQADSAEVRGAAIAAEADSFIASLPRGYDSVVGIDQDGLSGGQAQRIALAREFLKQPGILIMDEATSQLDSITERAIIETLFKALPRTTCIVISHRVNALVDFDLIVILDRGRIVATGTHSELLQGHELYQRLIGSSLEASSVGPSVPAGFGAI